MLHFLDNHLFSTQQYGFLKGRNTVIQLVTMLDIWTEALEEGGQIDVIYTDFVKAFDKVPKNGMGLMLIGVITGKKIALLKRFGLCSLTKQHGWRVGRQGQ